MTLTQEKAVGAPFKALTAFIVAIDIALILGSLRWPVPADAGVFHFAASQFLQGATPYRDLVDVNQPLTYWLHEVILLAGGPGDTAFRVFDLLCTALVATLAYLFCAPAGFVAAAAGSAFLLLIHLTFGAASAGQRDFVLLIPLLASALLGFWAAETDGQRRPFALLVSGATIGLACLIKPTAVMAVIVPLAAVKRPRTLDFFCFGLGGVLVAGLVLAHLARQGSLFPFMQIWAEHGAFYADFEAKPLWRLLRTLVAWGVRLSGFVIAAALVMRLRAEPRVRVACALALFGAAHFILQRKGYYYHLYPFICGIVLTGALSLPRARPMMAWLCALLIAATVVMRASPLLAKGFPIAAMTGDEPDTSSATAAMVSALEEYFPPHARIQVLDSDSGAFLAVARAGMRQATPQIYWFLLLRRGPEVQGRFMAQLRREQPAGILVTETEWPIGRGFAGMETWAELKAFIDEQYREVKSGETWRLYRRNL